jgi:hypothetical protein
MKICFLSVFFMLPVALLQGADSRGVDFYVSPHGKDHWSGVFAEPKADGSDGPLATLEAARVAVRRKKERDPHPQPMTVLLRGGIYPTTKPIVFSPEDSGSAEAPITYAAYPGEKPVLSGGVPIAGWQKGPGEIWTAVVPEVKAGRWYFRSLWVDGKRCTPARSPNEDWFFAAGPLAPPDGSPTEKSGFQFKPGDVKSCSNLEDAIVCVYHIWTVSLHRIQKIDAEKSLLFLKNPSQFPPSFWTPERRYYIENVPEALDRPGEFYLDRKTGVLSYWPRPGEEITKSAIMSARPESLLQLRGDAASSKCVGYLRFKGLAFHYTDWKMPEEESVDDQAASILRDATVFCRAAQHCTFHRCEIAHTGGYGLWFERGAKDNRLEQSHLFDLGAGGMRLGENALPQNPLEQAERNAVVNCFLHDGGKVYPAGAGVLVQQTSHNQVLHNEICDFLYTGVSVGWSWGYDPSTAHHNTVEFNHIHHLGWGKLSDMGGIYTLGVSPGTILRNNLIHDILAYSYGGWGLYTDEGSTGILLENNIVYRVKDGCFHQHYGKENVVRNNVLACSFTDGLIRRSRDEDHSSFTFERNIVYFDRADLTFGQWRHGEFPFDYNCYWDTSGRTIIFPGGLTFPQWQATGQDPHSLIADPKFVDPKNYDFRLQPDSPALKLGFQPIDPAQCGLTGDPQWTELPKQVQRPAMKFPGE